MSFVGDAVNSIGGVGSLVGGIGGGVGGILGGAAGNLLGNGLDGGLTNHYQSSGVNQEQIDAAYNSTQTGLQQQQNFLNALQAQNGIANQSSVYNQLQGVANGTGPNPAQAALANSTGQNISNQAALMASQRGTGANPALLARQAAQQGGNIQQQAAGQGAALQANQSLGALNQLGGIAGQQVSQQGNAQQTYNQNALQQQSNLLQANTGQNQVNAGVAAGNQNTKNQLIGGILNAGGSALAMAQGGQVSGGPRSHAARHLGGVAMASGGPVTAEMLAAKGAVVPGKASVKGDSYSNDTVPAILSPGEVVIPRHVMNGKNPADGAAKFVAAILANKAKGKK